MSVLSARTQRILEAPVLPLLLTLAAPNIGEAVARITFLTADAIFVSWLGSDALAGVAVVFPLFLVLQTATASGVGSGVSSAIGRALGAGDHARAQSLGGRRPGDRDRRRRADLGAAVDLRARALCGDGAEAAARSKWRSPTARFYSAARRLSG